MISLELVVNQNYLLTRNYLDRLKQLMNKTLRQKIVIDEREGPILGPTCLCEQITPGADPGF